MKDLNWPKAFKRAAVFTAIWLALVYFLNAVFPNSMSLRVGEDFVALGVNAVFFFFLYAMLAAFLERRRVRKERERKAQSSPKKGKGAKISAKTGDSEDEASDEEEGRLKGKYNPNTSRKKYRRRRNTIG